jgi:hypothetical protein
MAYGVDEQIKPSPFVAIYSGATVQEHIESLLDEIKRLEAKRDAALDYVAKLKLERPWLFRICDDLTRILEEL